MGTQRGISLVEAVIVMALLGVVMTTIVMIINPFEIKKEARDAVRLENLENINGALLAATLTENVSIADILCVDPTNPPCNGQSNDLNSNKVDGSGWVKVAVNNIKLLDKLVSFPILPIDPTNSFLYHYAYCSDGADWELNTKMESDKYASYQLNSKDKGDQDEVYELGSKLNLFQDSGGTCATAFVVPTTAPTSVPPTPIPTPYIAATVNGVGAGGTAIVVEESVNRIYVANTSGTVYNVSAISGTNNSVEATIGVSGSPRALAADPQLNRVYVSAMNAFSVSQVRRINSSSNSFAGASLFSSTWIPEGLAVNPINSRYYIALFGTDIVKVMAGGSNSVVADIALGSGADPLVISVNPTTNKGYVSLGVNRDRLQVVDVAAYTAGTIIGTTAYASAVNSVTNKIYVTNNSAGTVTVIDGATDTISGSPIAVGSGPRGIAVNPTLNRVYVANFASNTVSVIDGATGIVIRTITLPASSGPSAVAVNNTNNRLYILNATSATVTVYQDY